MEKMKIQVWSDIACPYCYIGKKKLENALSQFQHKDEIEIIWRSYELNPSLTKEPLRQTYTEYLSGHLGITKEEVEVNNSKIIAAAKEVGLTYNLDKLIVTNTCDALRMVKLANRHNLADEMEEILFKAYFTDGENVSDIDTLVRLGSNVGIPADEIKSMLSGTDFFDDVVHEIQYADGKLELEFIPFYLLNNKHIIQGSVSVGEYLKTLEKAYSDWKEHGEGSMSDEKDVISGKSCSIDGGGCE